MTCCLHRLRAGPGRPREGGFPGKRLASSQLSSASVQPLAGNSQLGSAGLGCRVLVVGRVPHSLCVSGEGAASQRSLFQKTLPSHSVQTETPCWKERGLGRLFSGEHFIPWGSGVEEASPQIQGIPRTPPPSFPGPRPTCQATQGVSSAQAPEASVAAHPGQSLGAGGVLQEACGGFIYLRPL